jgi:large subunit ribosomal protein L23
MDKSMSLIPRLSEKAYATSLSINTYVFDVPTTANKVTVKSAVEAQFGVTVTDIKMIVVKGKVKKSYQKRNRPVEGKRAKSKKAYVRLADGSTINLFGEPEDAKKTAKADKKEAKKPAKAAKETK